MTARNAQFDRSSRHPELPPGITHDDVYLMVMLHSYRRQSCEQIARRFGLTRAQVYDLLARRQVGGCCG